MDRITQTIVNPKYDGGAVNTSFIRYRYIDIIKGFTILWVISMHLEINPPFIDAAAQMGIFFFLSGMFYHPKNFRIFVANKFRTLIIPLFVFWGISVFVASLRYDIFSYDSSVGLLDFLSRFSYLRVNILWFLMALFSANVFYNYLYCKLDKNRAIIMFAISTVLYLAGSLITGCRHMGVVERIYENPLFPIGPFLVYQYYFVLGILLSDYAKLLENYKFWIVGFVLYSIVFRAIPLPYLIKIVPYTLLLIGLMLTVLRKIENKSVFRVFEFFGINSMILYLTHMLIIYAPVCRHFIDNNGEIGRVIMFMCVIIIQIPLIVVINRFCPWIVGKKRHTNGKA